MDIMYYTLNTRRVKVSGGADVISFVPAVRSGAAPEKKPCQVLDLELCRRQLETRQAWKQLARTVRDAEDSEEADEAELLPVQPLPRRERAAGWLELTASAALILAGLAASAAFLLL